MSKYKVKLLCMDVLIAALLLAFDQFTKHLAVVYLKGKEAFIFANAKLQLAMNWLTSMNTLKTSKVLKK